MHFYNSMEMKLLELSLILSQGIIILELFNSGTKLYFYLFLLLLAGLFAFLSLLSFLLLGERTEGLPDHDTSEPCLDL